MKITKKEMSKRLSICFRELLGEKTLKQHYQDIKLSN